MISASEFRVGVCFELDGEFYRLIHFDLVTAGGKAGAHYNTKLKNLKTGSTAERHFRTTDKFNDIEVVVKKKQYLYEDGEDIVFMDPETFEQVSYFKKNLGKGVQFLSENSEVAVLMFEDKLLGVEVPQFMELKIAQTAPGVHGGQGSSMYKPATLENGVEIQVPNFIKEGDKIKVNTHTGQYVDRVKE